MARRNDKLKVTHTQILTWAILHQESQRKEDEEKFKRLELTGTDNALRANLEEMLKKSIDEHNRVIEILSQMYEYENGTAFL